MTLITIWTAIINWINQALLPVPSGNDSQHVQQYYTHLHALYLGGIDTNRTHINWEGVFWIAFYALIMIVFFYLYTRYLLRTHRSKGEMYGAASFAGSILERIGPVSAFTWAISIVTILWALYYIITQVIYGQIY